MTLKRLLSLSARPSAVLAAAALLCGCAGFSDLRETETFFESYSAGEYDAQAPWSAEKPGSTTRKGSS